QDPLVKKYTGAPAYWIVLYRSWYWLAEHLKAENRLDEARHAARQSAKALMEVPAIDFYDYGPGVVPNWLDSLARLLTDLGESAEGRVLRDRAGDAFRQTIPDLEKLVENDPADPTNQSSLGAAQ